MRRKKREIGCKIEEASYIFVSGHRGSQTDAVYVGNRMRFMNHIKEQFANVRVVIVTSIGRKFIAFYAKQNINAGEELLFDYGEKYYMQWKFTFDKLVDNFAKKNREGSKISKQIRFEKDQSFSLLTNLSSN